MNNLTQNKLAGQPAAIALANILAASLPTLGTDEVLNGTVTALRCDDGFYIVTFTAPGLCEWQTRVRAEHYAAACREAYVLLAGTLLVDA